MEFLGAVSSYFHKEVDRYKTKILVSKVWDISYTVVNTEEDALLLENSLIKKYNPWAALSSC